MLFLFSYLFVNLPVINQLTIYEFICLVWNDLVYRFRGRFGREAAVSCRLEKIVFRLQFRFKLKII